MIGASRGMLSLRRSALAGAVVALAVSSAFGVSLAASRGEDEVGVAESVISSRVARSQYCLSDQAVAFAKSAEMIWFDRYLSGGAHTWIFNGAEVLKALNSYCGDTRLDVELLRQIRYILAPNRGPTATGGFQDQKQLGAAFMFLLARNTPRIWEQLTAAEKTKVRLNMEAHLYSTVFTTKDGVASSLGIDGNTGLHRDWNPNFQNGMVGMIIMTALYWGVDDFEAKLASFDYARFVAKLRANNMENLLTTYQNPASPSSDLVQAGLRKKVNRLIYAFHAIPHRNLLGLLGYISDRTVAQTINCGLNDGAGIGGWGRILQNCDRLPNVGKKGMLSEFAALDGGGPRSSAHYSYDGWYVLNYSRAALQLFNVLNRDTLATAIKITESGERTTMKNIINRYFLGTRDLYFKISPNKGGGYRDYSGGSADGTTVLDSQMIALRGGNINLEIFNILQRNLGQREIKQ
jgi:hypothetical protein